MEVMGDVALTVSEGSEVGQVRRRAGELARAAGFVEDQAGRLAIVVNELATNTLKHGGGGELVLTSVSDADVKGVDVLALDQGPGILSLSEALRDGYSTATTPGTGLGAVRRLASVFDIHAAPGRGTAVLARVWAQPLRRARARRHLEIGAVCLAKPGEEVCGDGWTAAQIDDRGLIGVADGLGHGLHAAEAARAAIQIVRARSAASPRALVTEAHGALRSTRGVALGVVEVDMARGIVRFAGVGNIAGTLWSTAGSRGMVSGNGILGHELRTVSEYTYPWSSDVLLVLHSDGLGSHWDLERYPGLTRRHPALIAGVLYRDFTRRRDDVTVVVARETGPAA
jgi:anti-sigma regulatory factor (Ser/Thr protein kinase)